MPRRGEEFWDERYRSASRVWSGNPNPQLVAEVTNLTPGTALDVGAGEGADSVWLAERGWTVTALDISSVALERARQHAQERRGEDVARHITFTHADLTKWNPPLGAFDLVSIQFLHMPSEERRPIYKGLAESVAPGGTLLVVGHHPSDLQTTAKRPPDPDLLFTAEDIARELDGGWDVIVQEARPRSVKDPEGAAITVHDAVLVARRKR